MYHVGIEKIQRAVEEANEQKKVAAKQRDRVAPKMGRMDVDYQVLHDAFFKWQTKPPLSGPLAASFTPSSCIVFSNGGDRIGIYGARERRTPSYAATVRQSMSPGTPRETARLDGVPSTPSRTSRSPSRTQDRARSTTRARSSKSI